MRSAFGSIQKNVVPYPAQRNVPGEPGTLVAESSRTAPPYPNPFLPGGQSGLGEAIGVSAAGGGFRSITAAVSGLRIRRPSNSPPLSSIRAHRRESPTVDKSPPPPANIRPSGEYSAVTSAE